MRDGNARICRYCDGARYARHNFKRDTGFGKSFRFFAAAAENERIAALQSAYVLAFASFFDHQPLDVLLLKALLAPFFTDIDHFSIRTCLFKQMQVNQPVVQNDVGFSKTRQTTDRDQIRISGARAANEKSPQVFHDVLFSRVSPTKSSMISLRRRSADARSSSFSRETMSESMIR